MKKWTDSNLMKFKKGKWKVLHLVRNNPMHQCKVKAEQLESIFTEKDLRFLTDKLSMRHDNVTLRH